MVQYCSYKLKSKRSSFTTVLNTSFVKTKERKKRNVPTNGLFLLVARDGRYHKFLSLFKGKQGGIDPLCFGNGRVEKGWGGEEPRLLFQAMRVRFYSFQGVAVPSYSPQPGDGRGELSATERNCPVAHISHVFSSETWIARSPISKTPLRSV